MRIPNLVSGILTISLAGFFYSKTFNFPQLQTQELGAEFMPRVYCTLLIILGGILIIQGLRDKSEKNQKENTMGYAVMTMLIVLVYLVIIPLLGFYISTVLVVFGLLVFSKVRNKIILFTIPIGTILFIFIFFQKLLKVSIPLGSLFS